MIIRKANLNELDKIMSIYSSAQNFMAENGNALQWGKTYPDSELIRNDITLGHLYVCTENDIIACVFYYSTAEDPTYHIIYNGQWLSDAPYGVVHRIASSRTIKGAAKFALNWAYSQCGNIRIDTHRDNAPMQSLLKGLGFKYCGIIHLENGDERLAYQKEGDKQ